jgi:hypothetical protein
MRSSFCLCVCLSLRKNNCFNSNIKDVPSHKYHTIKTYRRNGGNGPCIIYSALDGGEW